MDERVLEYLLYRGFIHSFRAVWTDCKVDRARAFEAETVVEEIFNLIQRHDLDGFHALWSFMDARFFSHLGKGHVRAVTELRGRLDRIFLVHAYSRGKHEVLHVFFAKFGPHLHRSCSSSVAGGYGHPGIGGDTWTDWFALPHLPDPRRNPLFAVYFTSRWQAQLRLSLTNFLSIIFRATPPPKLLLLEKWHRAVTQQRLRRGLVLQCRRVSSVRRQLGSHETNLAALLTATRNIIEHLHQSAVSAARREMREGSDTGGRPGPESDRLGTNVDVVDGAGRAIYGAVLSPSMRSVVGTEAASSLFDDDGDGMDDGAVSFSAKGAAAETRFKVLREAGTCVLSLADQCATEVHHWRSDEVAHNASDVQPRAEKDTALALSGGRGNIPAVEINRQRSRVEFSGTQPFRDLAKAIGEWLKLLERRIDTPQEQGQANQYPQEHAQRGGLWTF
jgi:hypothetical protein